MGIRLLVGAIVSVLVLPAFVWAVPVQCECVRYAREVMGVNVRGNAWTLRPNIPTFQMKEGDVVLYGKDHAAVIIGFTYRQSHQNVRTVESIIIADSNYVARCQPSVREISLFDPKIRGILSPDVN